MAVDDREDDRRNGESNEVEEDIENAGYKVVKDAILFAIDVSQSMLKPVDAKGDAAEQDSATLAALKCAYQLMQQRIISNPNDMMGVLLFGTQESKGLEDESIGTTAAYPHCYLVSDLDIPAAIDVKRLRDLATDADAAVKLLKPSDTPVSMANVLFCANQVFTTKAPNFTSRRLFLVTDNDNPHRKEKALRDSAAVRAKDLYDLGVTIELFPIAHGDSDFDRKAFYDDIIYRGPQDPDAAAPISKASSTVKSGDGISLLQSLISSVNSKAAPCRALFSTPLDIGPGLRIGIKGFINIKRQEVVKSCYVWVGGEKAQIVTGVGGNLNEDSARPVEASEIRKAFVFGGEQINFSDDERKTLKDFGESCIRILGFKPLSMLPEWANVRNSMFIYPDEDDFIGSTRTFSALHQKLLASQKFAFAWIKTRINAHPFLGALMPGAERQSDEGDQIRPPGLWIVTLPFADDIRRQPEVAQVRAPDELVDRMKVIMDLLRLPKSEYDPSRYPNPSLQYFYKVLQALALEEELPEKAEDKTVPRYKQIFKRTNEQVAAWKEELEQCWVEYQRSKPVTTLSSRPLKRENDDNGPSSKRAKPDTMADTEMREYYSKSKLDKLTVPVLTEWATRKNLHPSSKKKADVVASVESWFEKHPV